jgi:hypothetical protein
VEKPTPPDEKAPSHRGVELQGRAEIRLREGHLAAAAAGVLEGLRPTADLTAEQQARAEGAAQVNQARATRLALVHALGFEGPAPDSDADEEPLPGLRILRFRVARLHGSERQRESQNDGPSSHTDLLGMPTGGRKHAAS